MEIQPKYFDKNISCMQLKRMKQISEISKYKAIAYINDVQIGVSVDNTYLHVDCNDSTSDSTSNSTSCLLLKNHCICDVFLIPYKNAIIIDLYPYNIIYIYYLSDHTLVPLIKKMSTNGYSKVTCFISLSSSENEIFLTIIEKTNAYYNVKIDDKWTISEPQYISNDIYILTTMLNGIIYRSNNIRYEFDYILGKERLVIEKIGPLDTLIYLNDMFIISYDYTLSIISIFKNSLQNKIFSFDWIDILSEIIYIDFEKSQIYTKSCHISTCAGETIDIYRIDLSTNYVFTININWPFVSIGGVSGKCIYVMHSETKNIYKLNLYDIDNYIWNHYTIKNELDDLCLNS